MSVIDQTFPVAQSVILIGMPGAGKSTVGLLLAKALAKDFVDTDLLIQSQQGQTLQSLLDQQGYLALREMEQQALLSANYHHHVIATGGSAVYSEKGMAHLKTLGPVVYLEASLAALRQRIHNFDTRGIAKRTEQSFADMFAERQALYQRYADVVISAEQGNADTVAEAIVKALLPSS